MTVEFRNVREVIDAAGVNLITKEEARLILGIEKLLTRESVDGTIAMSFESKEVTA